MYDVTHNLGWVNVGIDHDTAAFAVESIRRWWRQLGAPLYPTARRLLLTADGGGSNGSRVRLWKIELQKLADETGLELSVCHLPPGTSKWNKIEHRLFSYISQNWRGKPLISHAVIVSLIAATTTKPGLKVWCDLDTQKYPTGVVVTDEELAQVSLKPTTSMASGTTRSRPERNKMIRLLFDNFRVYFAPSWSALRCSHSAGARPSVRHSGARGVTPSSATRRRAARPRIAVKVG